jgi:hypothetical protein
MQLSYYADAKEALEKSFRQLERIIRVAPEPAGGLGRNAEVHRLSGDLVSKGTTESVADSTEGGQDNRKSLELGCKESYSRTSRVAAIN